LFKNFQDQPPPGGLGGGGGLLPPATSVSPTSVNSISSSSSDTLASSGAVSNPDLSALSSTAGFAIVYSPYRRINLLISIIALLFKKAISLINFTESSDYLELNYKVSPLI
jgi:hypothetical protein